VTYRTGELQAGSEEPVFSAGFNKLIAAVGRTMESDEKVISVKAFWNKDKYGSAYGSVAFTARIEIGGRSGKEETWTGRYGLTLNASSWDYDGQIEVYETVEWDRKKQ
jgi:hypothetical protein